jgi:tetratricopeptide (TPR) repeat protein
MKLPELATALVGVLVLVTGSRSAELTPAQIEVLALARLAEKAQDVGQLAGASRLYERALMQSRKAFGEKSGTTADLMSRLADVYRRQGEFGKAEPLFKSSLAIWEKLPEKDSLFLATTLNNLAVLYQDMGQHAKAEPLYQRSLKIREAKLGKNHLDVAHSLNNLAALYKGMGQHTKAEPLYQRSLRIYEARLGKDHLEVATSLNNLAALCTDMGQDAKAESLYKRSLAICEARRGKDHPDVVVPLNHLALLSRDRGERTQALALFRRAVEVQAKAPGHERSPHYASSLNNLGTLLSEQGELAKAEGYIRDALKVRRLIYPGERFPKGHPQLAQALYDLGMLLLEQGQLRAAGEHLEDALRMRRALYPAGNHPDLAASLAGRGALQHALTDLEKAAEDFVEALDVHVAHLRQTVTRPRARLESLKRLRGTLSHLASLGTQEKKAARLFERVLDWKAQCPPHRALPPRVNLVANLQNALPSGAVLVELFEHVHSTPPKGVGRWTREQRLLVFVLRADKPLVCLDLGPTAPIHRAVEDWLLAVNGPAGKTAGGPAQELRQRVWLPIEKAIGKASTILLAPDGALARLPFAALPGRKAGSYLLEEVRIAYLPSALHLLGWSAPPARAARGLLLVGGLDYGKREKGPDWVALAGTRSEVERGYAVFTKRCPGVAVSQLAQDRAGKADLLRALTGNGKGEAWGCIHLATHSSPPRAAAETRAATAWGLVLSGANESEARGLLTADEIARLDLQGTDLVVLRVGRSALAHAPEELTLHRAFHAAGARSVIASLSDLHDAPTSLLMSELHNNLWEKKLSRLDALHQAQLFVLRNPDRVKALLTRVPDGPLPARPRKKLVRLDVPLASPSSPPAWWAGIILSGAIEHTPPLGAPATQVGGP